MTKWSGIEEQLMVALTSEQFEAWETLREERRARWEAHGDGMQLLDAS